MQPRSWPPTTINEIVSQYGQDPFDGNFDSIDLHSDPKSLADWRDVLVERVRTKTAMSRDIFEREPWDLFMTAYGDPHDVGHMFWHLHDVNHPLHDAKWAARYGDPVKDVYVELDRAIGDWVKLAGNRCHVVVFAGPGMSIGHTANGAMDELLSRIETFLDTGKGDPDLSYWVQQAYRTLVPHRIRRRVSIRQVFKGVAAPLRNEQQRPPLSHRKFFAVPHAENAGAVRFNVRGRESYGIVEPGAQLAALREKVIEELCRTINKHTGKPVVEKIVRTDQEFFGPQAQMLPDLLVIWNRDAPIRRLFSSNTGTIHVPPISRTGDHTSNVLFMVRTLNGSGRGQISGISRIEDVAPTIAGLLGVELSDSDGTALQWDNTHTFGALPNELNGGRAGEVARLAT
jgi:predicted AlkP superfamily phosphohydrolase/phosphomutase